MIKKPDADVRARTLDHFLGERARELRFEMLGLLDVARSRRAAVRRLEEPIRSWEAGARVHPPKESRFLESLEALVGMLESAARVYRRIHEAESRAHLLLTSLIEEVRRDQGRMPPGMSSMLEVAADLLAGSLTAIERALAVSARIGALTARCTATEVVALLDERRRALADADAGRARADLIDRRASRLETDLVEDLESAVVRALGADDEVLIRLN